MTPSPPASDSRLSGAVESTIVKASSGCTAAIEKLQRMAAPVHAT